jgi:uncharacterized protein YjbI with pentapeptide repeats
MANPEHLKILLEGVDAWNAWREGHQDVRLNLSKAALSKAALSKAALSGANLSGATLTGANLRRANLAGANLGGTIFGDTNLIAARGLDTCDHDSSSILDYGY